MRSVREPVALVAFILAACGQFGIDLADPATHDAGSDSSAPVARDAGVDSSAADGTDAEPDARPDSSVPLLCTTVVVPLTCNGAKPFTTFCQMLQGGNATDAGLGRAADGGGILLTTGASVTAGVFWVAVDGLSNAGFRLSARVRVMPQTEKPADGFGVALVRRDEAYDGGRFPSHSSDKGADVGLAGMVGFGGAAAVVHTFDNSAMTKVGHLEYGSQQLPTGFFVAATGQQEVPVFAAGEGVHLRIELERATPTSSVVATLSRETGGSFAALATTTFGMAGAFDIVGVSAASGFVTSAQVLESLEVCRPSAR